MYGGIIIIIVVYIIKVFTYHMPQAGMTDYIARMPVQQGFLCMYVCVCAHAFVHAPAAMYAHTHTHIYIYIWVHMHLYMYTLEDVLFRCSYRMYNMYI
jgi:hypothetical protein